MTEKEEKQEIKLAGPSPSLCVSPGRVGFAAAANTFLNNKSNSPSDPLENLALLCYWLEPNNFNRLTGKGLEKLSSHISHFSADESFQQLNDLQRQLFLDNLEQLQPEKKSKLELLIRIIIRNTSDINYFQANQNKALPLAASCVKLIWTQFHPSDIYLTLIGIIRPEYLLAINTETNKKVGNYVFWPACLLILQKNPEANFWLSQAAQQLNHPLSRRQRISIKWQSMPAWKKFIIILGFFLSATVIVGGALLAAAVCPPAALFLPMAMKAAIPLAATFIGGALLATGSAAIAATQKTDYTRLSESTLFATCQPKTQPPQSNLKSSHEEGPPAPQKKQVSFSNPLEI